MNMSVTTLLADRALRGWGLSPAEGASLLEVTPVAWAGLVRAADRGEAEVPDETAALMTAVIALKEMLDDRGLSDAESGTWIRGMTIGGRTVLDILGCGLPGFNIVFTRVMLDLPA